MKNGFLSKNQVNLLNKEFELGVFQKKYVKDYPILHKFLANVFYSAHLEIMRGHQIKYGFHGPEIIRPDNELQSDMPDFWLNNIGNYELAEVYASAAYSINQHPWMDNLIALSLKSTDNKDVFVPDNYLLMIPGITFNIDVADDGTLSSIEIIHATKPPSFIKELVRDFRLEGPSHRAKLRRQIKLVGTMPDEALLESIRFGKAITIEV